MRVAFTKFDIYVFTKARKQISCHAGIPTESFLDEGRHFSVVLYRLDVVDVRLYKQMDPSGVVFRSSLLADDGMSLFYKYIYSSIT
jgi:hypothetical protein